MTTFVPKHSGLRKMAKAISRSVFEPIPSSMRRRFVALDNDRLRDLSQFIRETYIHPPEYWETSEGAADLHSLTVGRMIEFRASYIPWLAKHLLLDGCRVLEIGCGTGASSFVLAEQGALVTGLDIEPTAIAIARSRFGLFGLEGRFSEANAVDVPAQFDVASYDLVIFFAVLEHMTHLECIDSLRNIIGAMRPGAMLAVVDTPNRLWYYDIHTSRQNFFNWLPDEIAAQYTRFLDRPLVNEIYKEADPELSLQRWGRGISFHEFELALGSLARLQVISGFRKFTRSRNPAVAAKWHLTGEGRFNAMLKGLAPNVHPVFFEGYLDFLAAIKGQLQQ